MPSFITVSFLLWVIVAGSALALCLLLAAVAGRGLRELIRRYRARMDQGVRPLVLAVIAGEEIPDGLTAAGGARGRAAERLIFSYLAQVRGEAHGLLTKVLERRGTVARVIRQSRRRWRYRRARAAEQLGLIASPAAERRLAELISGDSSMEVRIVATRGLGKAGSAGAATALLRSLSRANPVPEGIVAAALLELGPDGVPALREALSGKAAGGRHQRAMAAEVLGLLDDMPSWTGLAENLASADLEVRVSAIRALGRLGMPRAAGPVAGCLAPHEEPALRAVAARALGRIGAPESAPVLAACLDDPNYWVAHNAAEALAQLGPAGERELALAAAGHRPGMMHAREAMARGALARGEPPPTPLAAVAAGQAAGQPAGKAAAQPVANAAAHPSGPHRSVRGWSR